MSDLSQARLDALKDLHSPISHEEVLSLVAEVERLRAPDLAARVEALAKKWDAEATRRETDARAASQWDRWALRAGASFERNHADRLRALLSPPPPVSGTSDDNERKATDDAK